ncbi:MAG: acyl-CoA synthetase [Pseudomonadota bacterium]
MGVWDYKAYEEAYERFTRNDIWELYDGDENNFNIAHECIDRHKDKDTTAIRLKFYDGHTEKYTYNQMYRWSSQFANALKAEGIQPGDRVTINLDPSKEFYVSLFGAFKCGCHVVPCFSLFGKEALEYRIKDSKSKLLVTTEETAKVIDGNLVKTVLRDGEEFEDFIKGRPESFEIYPTKAKDIAVLQYTSGTTKKFPDAIDHFHKSLFTATANGIFVIGLRPGTRYFCPSSPGWGYGIWYATTVPLALGIPIGSYNGRFDEKRILEALEDFEIDTFSAAPTIYRRIKNSGLVDNYKLKLKRLTYAGEPCDLDTFEFLKRKFGVYPCGFYGSTEVGVILANFAGFDDWVVKPGAVGKPMPGGYEVAIIDREGRPLPRNAVGEIAIKRGKEWFYIKDAGVLDDDGVFWCKGRSDDVIISAGWTLSSVEIEGTLSLHEDIIEAAVIPVPDEDRGQVVKAYVQSNREPSEAFIREIQEFCKERLGKFEYPRQIEFLESIPKTPGGKFDRKALRDMAGIS